MANRKKQSDNGAMEALKAGAKAGAKAGLRLSLGGMIVSEIADELEKLSAAPNEELEAFRFRSEIEAELMKAHAKASQELSLAKRILTATEVEIEEFFDTRGEGGLGLKGDMKTETLTLGAHGSGSHVTRRVIRLKGWRDDQPPFEAILDEDE